MKMIGDFSGMHIYESEFLSPDFYAIADWKNAKDTATPEWHNVLIVAGKVFAHPTLLNKLKEQTNENTK